MPYLKAILLNANDKSNCMLRAKAMECISLVGMAVGKEKFREDAKQVVVTFVLHYFPFFFFSSSAVRSNFSVLITILLFLSSMICPSLFSHLHIWL